MILLFDIGNTHTHLGLAGRVAGRQTSQHPDRRVARGRRGNGSSPDSLAAPRWKERRFAAWFPAPPRRCAACSGGAGAWRCLELGPGTLRGVGIDYPRPETIGADRLANAVAVARHFSTPAVVVDFGTAVTFDVVDRSGNYIGGIITPGLAAMTDYLHEKTALLPASRSAKSTPALAGIPGKPCSLARCMAIAD